MAPRPAGEIRAKSKVDVWSEVIPPFNLMPRDVLIATCNTVMRGLMNSLLPMFVRQLGEDYQKWATDKVYREQRAARSKPPLTLAATSAGAGGGPGRSL